ncbi:hypothetical protein ACFW9D_06090 [Streptomyces sp. NPDC059524]|uniref:hypothetical protein n=1 Tax=Streptomyces sp. NPDC059524 TaxID=3346856 RepID=UPI0036C0F00F
MEHHEVSERIEAVFARVMGTPPVKGLDTRPEDTETWDSLAHVELFTALESDLARRLPRELMLIGPELGAFAAALKAAP